MLFGRWGPRTSQPTKLRPFETSLQLHPLDFQDFDELVSHGTSYPPGDDLVGPPTPICWPVKTREEAQTRLAFHFTKQRSRFRGDPTVRYMKVIDTANKNSIISIARWHFYPNGYNFNTEIHWETHNLEPGQSAPYGFNIALHNHILTTRDAARRSWIPENTPCWILMHMVTHPSHRGKGAAGLLVNWGIEQAERDHVPAYLEAGLMGRPVYERFDFVEVGDMLQLDLKEFNVDMMFRMIKMAYFPREEVEDGAEIAIDPTVTSLT